MVSQKNLLYSLLAVLAIIVVVGGVGIFLVVESNHNNQNQPKNTSGNKAPNVNLGDQTDQGLSVNIVRAVPVGNDLQVGTSITGTQTGTCVLTVSQDGQKSVTETEQVAQQDNGFVCPEFDVPLSNFPNQNEWNVGVSLTVGSQTVTSEWQNNPVNLSAS